jgi:hypothetical protein
MAMVRLAPMATVRCNNCKLYNQIPSSPPQGFRYRCGNCGAFLERPRASQVGSAGVVGAAGGAALGAALGGLPGALIGTLIGFLAGSSSEGR